MGDATEKTAVFELRCRRGDATKQTLKLTKPDCRGREGVLKPGPTIQAALGSVKN
jgi:hypothetical protein